MSNLKTVELRPFLPSKDFKRSKQFYEDLGFDIEPLGDDLAGITHGAAKFFLSDSYNKEFAEGLQMHLLVEDVDSWWAHAFKVIPNYGGPLDAVTTQPWGMRDFAFQDPAGVCWRVAEEVAS